MAPPTCFAAFAHSSSTFSVDTLTWFQLLFKPFAFAFLAFTYYFSKKPSKNTRLMWDITLSALIVALTSMVVLFFVAPFTSLFSNYRIVSIYTWSFNIVCLLYITIHTLRSHLAAQDSNTILTPFGYILLGIGQYSLLIWSVDGSTLSILRRLSASLDRIDSFPPNCLPNLLWVTKKEPLMKTKSKKKQNENLWRSFVYS